MRIWSRGDCDIIVTTRERKLVTVELKTVLIQTNDVTQTVQESTETPIISCCCLFLSRVFYFSVTLSCRIFRQRRAGMSVLITELFMTIWHEETPSGFCLGVQVPSRGPK